MKAIIMFLGGSEPSRADLERKLNEALPQFSKDADVICAAIQALRTWSKDDLRKWLGCIDLEELGRLLHPMNIGRFDLSFISQVIIVW